VRALVRRFALLTLLGISACGDSPPTAPPTAPSPAPPQTPTLTQLSLTPVDISFTAPGQSVQLMVMALFSDGNTRNVTTDVTWKIDKPEVLSIDRGVMTSRGYGWTSFEGDYQGKFLPGGLIFVNVPKELALPLTGVVRDQYGRPVPFAQIVGTSGPMLGATADANGAFDLGLTYGPVRLAAGRFGYETTETAVMVAGGPVRAELLVPESPSPYAEQDFEATSQGGWQTHRIQTRAGGPVDLQVLSPDCIYRSVTGVLTVRLTGAGVRLGEEAIGCAVRVRQTAPADDVQLEVSTSTPARYRVTYRVPR